MGSSTYSTPPFAQSSTSEGLIGREALARSVSPAQNFLKPPPVPLIPTVTWMPRFARPNSSAIASMIGNTVLEPSTFTGSARAASSFLHPPTATARPTATPSQRPVLRMRSLLSTCRARGTARICDGR